MRELTENYDRLMLELRSVVSQLSRLAAMKDSIEEAGGQLPPHVAAGLRKVDARLRNGRSGDALKVADPKTVTTKSMTDASLSPSSPARYRTSATTRTKPPVAKASS